MKPMDNDHLLLSLKPVVFPIMRGGFFLKWLREPVMKCFSIIKDFRKQKVEKGPKFFKIILQQEERREEQYSFSLETTPRVTYTKTTKKQERKQKRKQL